jgi:biotin synthase
MAMTLRTPTAPLAGSTADVRNDWTREEVRWVFGLPLPELIFRAQTAHRAYFDPTAVQISTLLSIKTGGCP